MADGVRSTWLACDPALFRAWCRSLQAAVLRADTQRMSLKQMALRHSGVCRVCGVELPAKTMAVYDFGTPRTSRSVTRSRGFARDS